ncbi:MAG: GLPGLI family protein [Saprospiraceae bacterium]|nr:GLPGLI family protein [Saprospiraceae bacterium]
MNRYYFIAAFILLSFQGFAQPKTSGKIVFTETFKLNIDVPDGNPEFAKMIPPSQSQEKVLFFRGGESLFKNLEKAKDTEITHEEGDNSFQFVMKMPESSVYINADDQILLQYQDLMDKEFLITDKPTKHTWKVTNEQKKILDFVCQKAILLDTTRNLAAWFTSQIPVSGGPNGMSGLPGMILAIEEDNGNRMTLAIKVEDLPQAYTFEKPKKGKKVSKKEFEKIRAEKMKEMGVGDGKGSGMKMIIREERH